MKRPAPRATTTKMVAAWKSDKAYLMRPVTGGRWTRRSIVAAIGRRQIFGDETAGVTRRAIDDEVEVPLHDVGPPQNPGELSSDPCAIARHEDAQHEQQVHFEVRRFIEYLAVGIDPNLTTICLQSHLPALAD